MSGRRRERQSPMSISEEFLTTRQDAVNRPIGFRECLFTRETVARGKLARGVKGLGGHHSKHDFGPERVEAEARNFSLF